MDKNHSAEIISRDLHCILGLPFDVIDLAESANLLENTVNKKERCFLSTPNLNFVISAQSDEIFFNSVLDSNLSVADGMPLVWVAKLLGIPLRERVAGSTLFKTLSSEHKLSKNIRIFFFGGNEGVAQQAYERMGKLSEKTKACGYYDPGFVSVSEMSSPEIIAEINKTNPDFLVVALGAKKGQEWIQMNKHLLNSAIISHLGAVINFVAGSVERAPESWQRYGLEWLWRIKQEPGLWRRYFFDGIGFLKLLLLCVFPLAILDWFIKLRNEDKEAPSVKLDVREKVFVEVIGSFKHGFLDDLKLRLHSILKGFDKNVVMDCSNLRYIDSAFIGSLLLFQRKLNGSGRSLSLVDVPYRIKIILKLSNIFDRFSLASR